jgi:CzcA family heavy metal efflux pump
MALRAESRTGGVAAWSIRHPIGVVMIALAMMVLGLVALWRLPVDLLPHIIYPEISVRILDPGVPATVMEDRVTRMLEEQLAITEDAVAVQSQTREGNSSVDLTFQYGKDMDIALRDASTRLDRARRFLPDTIDPPVIFKRDPSQIPVAEYIISSPLWDPVELRDWVDYQFATWFITLPGVAAAEVAGGLVREIQILPDQGRLAGLGLSVEDLAEEVRAGNLEQPAGRLLMTEREYSGRTRGRLTSVAELRALPVPLPGGGTVPLGEVAQVLDSHEDQRIRARMNGIPGVVMTIQKQPTANTVATVDVVEDRLDWLRSQGLLPGDLQVHKISDQAIYVRNAVNNAAGAAMMGALLAMLVVYVFLGDLRRTLVVGSAMPIAVLVTFVLMDLGGLTVNIMTLGGLAVGIGMLVDSTIVMLENIHRHQREGDRWDEAGQRAAEEVNSAIVASGSTNLAAILPFLFVSGLVGLLFRELIVTVSAAVVAALVVALTVVPALGSRVPMRPPGAIRRGIDALMRGAQAFYGALVYWLLRRRLPQLLVMAAFVAGLVLTVPFFLSGKQVFLPEMDDGRLTVRVTGDPGISVEEMDRAMQRLEDLVRAQPEVETVYTLVGGFIFGRTQRESSNSGRLTIQLVPLSEREVGIEEWIRRMDRLVAEERLAGMRVQMQPLGIRGVRVGRGDEDVSIRIQGPDLDTLFELGEAAVDRLQGIPGVTNLSHSAEEILQEIAVEVDRERASDLGLSVEEVGDAFGVALDGRVVTDFIDGDRAYDVRLRLPRADAANPQDLESLLLYAADGDSDGAPIYLGDVARVHLVAAPAQILRDNQRRAVEVTGTVSADVSLGEASLAIHERLADLPLPEGYNLYDAGAALALQEGQRLAHVLLGLALFLVLVVMAVQYESLRNPVAILLGVPFATIGVALGLQATGMPISMPVWLGLIMLAGIVVNNAIVLVEFVELLRERGTGVVEAVVEAARLRLRPILMTTLTTVAGLTPLAIGIGEGAEMLQPLAVTIVSGLSFSLLVSLLLIPVLYRWFHPR